MNLDDLILESYNLEIYSTSFNSQYEELAWFVHLSMQKPIYQIQYTNNHDGLSQSEPTRFFHIVGLTEFKVVSDRQRCAVLRWAVDYDPSMIVCRCL